MQNLIFSLSSVLGKEVRSTKGTRVATLVDLICNKDTGRLTYLVLSAEGGSESDQKPATFAVHHSYFYFPDGEEHLVFSHKLGNEDQSFFLELPDCYGETEVGALMDFTDHLQRNTGVAGHRSDNDFYPRP